MTKRRIPAKLKQIVYERAFGFCEYCVSPDIYSTDIFSNEHIEPESRGGGVCILGSGVCILGAGALSTPALCVAEMR